MLQQVSEFHKGTLVLQHDLRLVLDHTDGKDEVDFSVDALLLFVPFSPTFSFGASSVRHLCCSAGKSASRQRLDYHLQDRRFQDAAPVPVFAAPSPCPSSGV